MGRCIKSTGFIAFVSNYLFQNVPSLEFVKGMSAILFSIGKRFSTLTEPNQRRMNFPKILFPEILFEGSTYSKFHAIALQNYPSGLTVIVHFMFIAANSTARYLKTYGKATLCIYRPVSQILHTLCEGVRPTQKQGEICFGFSNIKLLETQEPGCCHAKLSAIFTPAVQKASYQRSLN